MMLKVVATPRVDRDGNPVLEVYEDNKLVDSGPEYYADVFKKDYLREVLVGLEEEFFHIIGEDSGDKATEIRKAIFKEVGL